MNPSLGWCKSNMSLLSYPQHWCETVKILVRFKFTFLISMVSAIDEYNITFALLFLHNRLIILADIAFQSAILIASSAHNTLWFIFESTSEGSFLVKCPYITIIFWSNVVHYIHVAQWHLSIQSLSPKTSPNWMRVIKISWNHCVQKQSQNPYHRW